MKLSLFWVKLKIPLYLFLLIFSLSLSWSLIVPGSNEAPDEAAHLNMIDFFQSEHRIPVFNKEDKIIPTQYDQTLLSGAYYSMAYNSPLSYLPYLLFDHHDSLEKPDIISMRLVSGILIGFFAVFLFLGLKNLKPENSRAALLSSMFISLIPQVIFSGAYINIEPMALFLAALSFYFYTRLSETRPLTYLPFAASLGLLGLSKANYLIVIVYFFMLLAIDLFKSKRRFLSCKNSLLVILIIIAINLWWWIRNYQLYQDPLIFSYIKEEIINRAPPWFSSFRQQGYNIFSIFGNHYFSKFAFKGFFANLGGANIFLPNYFYIIFYGFITGVLFLSWRQIIRNKYLLSFLVVTISFLIYFANKNLDDFSPQGRHFFPLLVPLAVSIFYGLIVFKRKYQKVLSIFLLVFSIGSLFYGLFAIVDGYYVKGFAYVNEGNKAKFLAHFSWKHPSLENYSDLLGLLRLSDLLLIFLILASLLSVICFYYLYRTEILPDDEFTKKAT